MLITSAIPFGMALALLIVSLGVLNHHANAFVFPHRSLRVPPHVQALDWSRMRNDRDQSERPVPQSVARRSADGVLRSSTAVMGIPKMFRWLVDLFPQVTHDISAGTLSGLGAGTSAGGISSGPVSGRKDAKSVVHDLGPTRGGGAGTGAKKRAVDNRVDNLYIDMLVALDERRMFQRIFTATDRVYKMVRPRRLLYLGIDGVAPRAKMNQQRARRFRASKEREVLLEDNIAQLGLQEAFSQTNSGQGTGTGGEAVSSASTFGLGANIAAASSPSAVAASYFDSNCITPGTDFMFRLGVAFRGWIAHKLATDPFWRGPEGAAAVVFSGSDVPGEGEHKIMEWIRREQKQRRAWLVGAATAGGVDRRGGNLLSANGAVHTSDGVASISTSTAPSASSGLRVPLPVSGRAERHCLYGLDADLIMLGLVTHEPNFVLLREKLLSRKLNPDMLTYTADDFELLEVSEVRRMLGLYFRSMGRAMDEHRATVLRKMLKDRGVSKKAIADAENISKVKGSPIGAEDVGDVDDESLARLLSAQDQARLPPRYSVDRIIDDFVLVCVLVGNDFLPHLPHLDIANGSINFMMSLYKELMPLMGGYLTDKSRIHLGRLELFTQGVAAREPLYFEHRGTEEGNTGYLSVHTYREHYYYEKFGINVSSTDDLIASRPLVNHTTGDFDSKNIHEYVSRHDLHAMMAADLSRLPPPHQLHLFPSAPRPQHLVVRHLVTEYVKGLLWVLEYYHSGCRSWTWYYPDLYAPLASDFVDLPALGGLAAEDVPPVSKSPQPPSPRHSTAVVSESVNRSLGSLSGAGALRLPEGKPFTPLMQLLSVLPPQSVSFLPICYGMLMVDPASPLLPAYPSDFDLDANGKHNSWECVAVIPFLNQSELVSAVGAIDHAAALTTAERLRNIPGEELVFLKEEGASGGDSRSGAAMPTPADFVTPSRPQERVAKSGNGKSNSHEKKKPSQRAA